MDRELNLEVFEKGGKRPVQPRGSAAEDLKTQVVDLSRRVVTLEEQIQSLKAVLKDLGRAQAREQQKGQSFATRLESQFQVLLHEVRQRLTGFKGQISDQKALEVKVQDLIDRQHLVLQNFESRLSQLQSTSQDQQYKILSTAAVLENLKKMI